MTRFSVTGHIYKGVHSCYWQNDLKFFLNVCKRCLAIRILMTSNVVRIFTFNTCRVSEYMGLICQYHCRRQNMSDMMDCNPEAFRGVDVLTRSECEGRGCNYDNTSSQLPSCLVSPKEYGYSSSWSARRYSTWL